jgi:(S)-citramalyl-CoA lyase
MKSLDAANLSGQICDREEGAVSIAITNFLFASGARPDRFARASASGADLVCIDLEDSVPPNGKAAAREAAIAAVRADNRLAIRINAVSTARGVRDLVALADSGVRPATLFVPMVEAAEELRVVRAAIGDVPLIPLVETIRALDRVAAIASAPGVAAMMFGGGDLSAELGVALEWEPLAVARGRFVMGCAGAGVPAIDVPWIGLDDQEGLEVEARRAKAMGFAAKAAIHPAQIETLRAVFDPTTDEIAEARAAEAAFDAAGGAAVRFNGRMLEAPVMRRYRRIIERADNKGNSNA